MSVCYINMPAISSLRKGKATFIELWFMYGYINVLFEGQV